MNSLDTDHAAAAASSNLDAEQNRTGAQIPYGSGITVGTNAAAWEINTSYWLLQNDVTVVAQWAIDLSRHLPHGVTVTQVQALVNGNALSGTAHSSISGMTLPSIQFLERSSTGTANYFVVQADTSPDVGSYEVDHNITLTVSRTVNRLMHYIVTIAGESSTHATNQYFAVKGLSVSWTAP